MTTPDPIRLPCGCLLESMIIDGLETTVMTACAAGADCKWVQYTVEETRKNGKPVRTIG